MGPIADLDVKQKRQIFCPAGNRIWIPLLSNPKAVYRNDCAIAAAMCRQDLAKLPNPFVFRVTEV